MTEEQRIKRNQRQQRWQSQQDRINFVMPPGTKERINRAAAELNISAAEFIRQAINEKLTDLDNFMKE